MYFIKKGKNSMSTIKQLCIFVGLSCAVSRSRYRILTAVYKMFKTSEPCTKVLQAEILYLASRRRALYKGELVLNILYTTVRILHRARTHMTDQQIYFSG